MRKIIIIISILTALNCNADTTFVDINTDTTFLNLRPNHQDTINVIKIVNSVQKVAEVVTANKPFLNGLVSSEILSGGLVALILGIIRRIELRRLKRKNKI